MTVAHSLPEATRTSAHFITAEHSRTEANAAERKRAQPNGDRHDQTEASTAERR